ncbi:MAG: hypothetical protein JWM38_469 [Sphingomonas bacterium]|jgi:uncharacterized metal-binding protein YceD (DUF177 family)|nr:hypothetical protein [Sphingomonas bacterium]MDB5684812.1 hypothetical protein [Sphingomonas bacterium]MDB5717042.1 hypothetical protein [Sphingomonas bacterium]
MTTPTANEFARPIRLDALGGAPHDFHFEADPAERAALAARFDLPAIERLAVSAAVRREGQIVYAEGRITAKVVQQCVASGDLLAAAIAEPFSLRFMPQQDGSPDDEIELSDGDCDTQAYSGSAIDLGEAAAETLLLALDPFPRRADADEVLRAAGVVGEQDVGPFAALKALKDKLGK